MVISERFADLRWAGFLRLMFMRSTKLSNTTKLSAEHETPPIANVLLAVVILSIYTRLLLIGFLSECKDWLSLCT